MAQTMAAAAVALALGSGVVLGEFLASPLRYRAGRVGAFFRTEGPPGLRRAVGQVVRLEPARSQQTTGTASQRSRSVALEPASDAYGAEPFDSGHGHEDEY